MKTIADTHVGSVFPIKVKMLLVIKNIRTIAYNLAKQSRREIKR